MWRRTWGVKLQFSPEKTFTCFFYKWNGQLIAVIKAVWCSHDRCSVTNTQHLSSVRQTYRKSSKLRLLLQQQAHKLPQSPGENNVKRKKKPTKNKTPNQNKQKNDNKKNPSQIWQTYPNKTEQACFEHHYRLIKKCGTIRSSWQNPTEVKHERYLPISSPQSWPLNLKPQLLKLSDLHWHSGQAATNLQRTTFSLKVTCSTKQAANFFYNICSEVT